MVQIQVPAKVVSSAMSRQAAPVCGAKGVGRVTMRVRQGQPLQEQGRTAVAAGRGRKSVVVGHRLRPQMQDAKERMTTLAKPGQQGGEAAHGAELAL